MIEKIIPEEIELDIHTHTIVSGHAYSTINEMVHAAERKGLKLLCITEHGPSLPGAPNPYYFTNLKVLKKNPNFPVKVVFGMEANIISLNGTTDYRVVPDMGECLDYVIASWHPSLLRPSLSMKENTKTYLSVLDSPDINVLGHIDDGSIPCHYEPIVEKAAMKNVMIELNNSSFLETSYRVDSEKNAIEILELCKKYRCPVVLGSDAHADFQVGDFCKAISLLYRTDFPKELIVYKKRDFLARLKNIEIE